ncbi:MAG TPA: tetratricopeptide repeat protein [Kiritimatiellia bacterium]|nr:tetratricopeptide repeat protein [Kiritimatiellia bacterium]
MTANKMRISRFWIIALLAGAAWMPALAQNPFVILPNGNRVDGTAIRSRADGTVILTTGQGEITYARGQYQRAEAVRPPDFDRARQLAQQGKPDDAIRLLEQVATNFRFLHWDTQSRISIAQILASKGDHTAAVTAYERLFQASPELRRESAVLWGYLTAMVEAKQFDKLSPMLEELIARGSRTDVARAQVLRGDLKMAQGQVEGAVMDYLRSVLLYESERTVLPEALVKAAEGLERLRDPRSREMYRRVAQEFPGTSFAQRAQGKF